MGSFLGLVIVAASFGFARRRDEGLGQVARAAFWTQQGRGRRGAALRGGRQHNMWERTHGAWRSARWDDRLRYNGAHRIENRSGSESVRAFAYGGHAISWCLGMTFGTETRRAKVRFALSARKAKHMRTLDVIGMPASAFADHATVSTEAASWHRMLIVTGRLSGVWFSTNTLLTNQACCVSSVTASPRVSRMLMQLLTTGRSASPRRASSAARAFSPPESTSGSPVALGASLEIKASRKTWLPHDDVGKSTSASTQSRRVGSNAITGRPVTRGQSERAHSCVFKTAIHVAAIWTASHGDVT